MNQETSFDLAAFYDDYPRVEEEFQQALTESLQPRGPELLYDLVAGLGLGPQASALDVGCGEGGHTILLAERFGFSIHGIDPVPRHIELAYEELAAATPELREKVSKAEWLYQVMGVVPSSADPSRTDEKRGSVSPKLLHTARLLRDPQR